MSQVTIFLFFSRTSDNVLDGVPKLINVRMVNIFEDLVRLLEQLVFNHVGIGGAGHVRKVETGERGREGT